MFFILAKIEVQIGWAGLDSILLMLAYGVAIYLIQQNASPLAAIETEIPEKFPSLRRGMLGFLIAAGVLAHNQETFLEIGARASSKQLKESQRSCSPSWADSVRFRDTLVAMHPIISIC